MLSALSCSFNLAGFFLCSGIREISGISDCGVIDLGISVCYKVLEQREGQDVVSLGPSESSGLCVSQSQKQLVPGNQRKKCFILKSCTADSARFPWLGARGSELSHHSTQDMQKLNWEGSTKRFKSLR